MPIIKIGTSDYKGCLRERLFFELEFLQEDGIIIDISEIKQGDTLIFKCEFIAEEDRVENLTTIIRESVANVLSDVIINYIEEDILNKILRNNYNYFNKKEEEEILQMAMDRLNFLVSKEDDEIISQIQRKNRLLLEIIEYLSWNNEIILEGFVRFRVKSYLIELESAINRAVDDFAVEQEYEEFIQLLKYFIDNQDPKNKLINVVKTEEGHFKLLNDIGIVIENTYLDEYILKMADCELDYEGLLISALITAAPEEIILHFKEPISLIKTLENVFSDKISICLGCKYCKMSSFNELE